MSRILITFFALIFCGVTKAEVFRDRNDDGTNWCMLQGSITKNDVMKFSNALKLGCKQMQLNSLGGDVDAAMDMGRALRKAQIPVVVPQRMQCASACVFVYAGGVLRINYGEIKIHRPYAASFDGSFEALQEKFKRMELNVKKYLQAMNVSDQLFDRMIQIPPEKTETLSLEDIDRLGIGFKDPVYDNYLDQMAARQNGVALAAWLKAKNKARSECGDIDKPSLNAEESRAKAACWNQIMPFR